MLPRRRVITSRSTSAEFANALPAHVLSTLGDGVGFFGQAEARAEFFRLVGHRAFQSGGVLEDYARGAWT